MKNIKVVLPSYPKFAKYQDKMNKKIDQLQSRIDENEEQIAALTKEYSIGFAEDADLTEVSSKLRSLRDYNKQLRDEMAIINDSDYREKELASAIYDEYRELEKELNTERTRLFEQAEKILKDAEAAVEKIDSDFRVLANQFDVEIGSQMRQVVDHLEMNEGARQTIKNKAYSGLGMGSYSQFLPILKRK